MTHRVSRSMQTIKRLALRRELRSLPLQRWSSPSGPGGLPRWQGRMNFVVIPRSMVDTLNTFQIKKAVSHVYFRPRAPLRQFLVITRPPLKPKKKL